MKNKEPITVEIAMDKKCYICGRNSADIRQIFDAKQLKTLCMQAVEERNSQIQAELKAYVDSLKELYSKTRKYHYKWIMAYINTHNIYIRKNMKGIKNRKGNWSHTDE